MREGGKESGVQNSRNFGHGFVSKDNQRAYHVEDKGKTKKICQRL